MTTNDDRIKLARVASMAHYEALCGTDVNQRILASIHHRAAKAADDVATNARFLIGKLSEAVAQLEAAGTTREARLAVAWLQNDAWDRMQRALTTLEALDELLA